MNLLLINKPEEIKVELGNQELASFTELLERNGIGYEPVSHEITETIMDTIKCIRLNQIESCEAILLYNKDDFTGVLTLEEQKAAKEKEVAWISTC